MIGNLLASGMNRRSAYWIAIAILLCSTGFFAWRYLAVERQLVAASFIRHQIETTQQGYIDSAPDVRSLAVRLNFLHGYFEHEIQYVDHPVLRRSLERDYRLVVTNAVVALRNLTNDLGADPTVWIDAYGK